MIGAQDSERARDRERPIRVLFTIPNFISAGSGRAMLNIVERLDRAAFEPSVAVLKRGGTLESEIERQGVPLLEAQFLVPAKPYATLYGRARAAAAAFRPHGFDLWHSFHYADDYTEPIVARLSGARAWVYTKKNMSWRDRAWRLRTFFASRIAAQNTEMIERFFSGRLARHKVRFVPRGVDTGRFTPDNTAALGIRGEIDPSRVAVGCVAHLMRRKRQMVLVESVARVPGIHLFLAGKPLEEAYARGLGERVRELGIEDRVTFLGNVEDVSALLADLDVFVLPSESEGCPVALLEAMAAGRASVAAMFPGVRDVIEDGRSGLLVPPDDAEALADALRMLAEFPEVRARLGAAARKRVLDSFTIERETADHERLYREALRCT